MTPDGISRSTHFPFGFLNCVKRPGSALVLGSRSQTTRAGLGVRKCEGRPNPVWGHVTNMHVDGRLFRVVGADRALRESGALPRRILRRQIDNVVLLRPDVFERGSSAMDLSPTIEPVPRCRQSTARRSSASRHQATRIAGRSGRRGRRWCSTTPASGLLSSIDGCGSGPEPALRHRGA